jgi:hypothetical protein
VNQKNGFLKMDGRSRQAGHGGDDIERHRAATLAAMTLHGLDAAIVINSNIISEISDA